MTDTPLVLAAGFTVPGTWEAAWGCPAYNPMPSEYDLTWSLQSMSAPHIAGPAANGSAVVPGPDTPPALLPPPLGAGNGALVAVVPGSGLASAWVRVSVVARARDVRRARPLQTQTAVLRVWRSPLCAGDGAIVVERRDAGSVTAGGAVSLALRTHCPLPGGYAFRWDYEPPGGFPVPVTVAAPAFQSNATAAVPWWLPVANATTLAFGVRVVDPAGAAQGPLLGRVAVPVHVPSGNLSALCRAASVVEDPALHLRCTCADAALSLSAHGLPAVGPACAAGADAVLRLLQVLHDGCARRVFGPADADRPAAVEALVVAVGQCAGGSAEVREALVRVAHAALFAGLPDPVPRLPGLTPALDILDVVLRARQPWGNCTFPAAAAVGGGPLQLRFARVLKTRPGALSIGNAFVALPDALPNASGSDGAAMDVRLRLVPLPPPAVAPAVAVGLSDPFAAADLPPQALPAPVVVSFPLPGPGLRTPAEDWYRCARATDAGWTTEGVRLTADDQGLHCHATALATYVVLPAVRVTRVRGCALDTSVSTLHCLPDSPATVLRVQGYGFGSRGVGLALATDAADPSSGRWGCMSVRHHRVAEEDEVVCAGLHPLGGAPPGPGAVAAYLTLTTSYGLSHTFRHPIFFAARLHVTGLVPLPASPFPCLPHNSTAIHRCPVAAAAFAVQGAALAGYGPTTVTVGPFTCPTVAVHNASYVTCHGLHGHGGPHPVRVATQTLSSAPRAALTLSFVDPCAGQSGHWEGPGCARCRRGFYGPGCAGQCACSGHGQCADGLIGDGACACDRDAERGFWAGADCSICAWGWGGPNCTWQCPTADPHGVGRALVCGGRGICRADTGRCACVAPYTGADCTFRCPAAAGQACAGHGNCMADSEDGAVLGRCDCSAGHSTGHWAGVACEHCRRPYVGPNCTAQCPGLCVGHGRCVWDRRGPTCECSRGFVGLDCAQACPVGVWGDVCAGHGTCVAGGGAAICACAASTATGHWMGPACEECAVGWVGAACDVPCPHAAPSSAVCSARGNCTRDGRCACAAGTCGPACEWEAGACAASSCPNGRYGRDCAGLCNCSVTGVCFDGPFGTGECLCLTGWAGPRCDVLCPVAPGGVCSGHGMCDRHTGHCRCAAEWRTRGSEAPCGAPCPRSGPGVCSAHGRCTADALCICDDGYSGTDCSQVCPQPWGGAVCSGHGTCTSGGCSCTGNAELGFWAGPACDACAPGFAGPSCQAACVNGVTSGWQCLCTPGYARPNCSVACPGSVRTGGLCFGHGTCDDGADGTGECVCYAGYAGGNCDLVCPGGAANTCSGHGQCDAVTGTCQCQDSAAGRWGGAACDRCRGDFFGVHCDLSCPVDTAGHTCGLHGLCTGTGTCACYADRVRGFWDGAACSDCRYCPGGLGTRF